MNWLAHVFLSEADVEFRLGNLLADLVKGRGRVGMPAAFLEGVRRHERIDAFTDTHPVVRRSRARLGAGFRHTRGILVDVFYDHFLALDWRRYSAEPLGAFTARFYVDALAHPIALPHVARVAVERMVQDDRLGSYLHLEGIESSLRRVSLRLAARRGREVALERAVPELVNHFEALRGDFAEFFPELQAHVGMSGRSQ